MKRIAVNTLLLFAGICAAAAPRALVDIRDFGAVGDGRTINTQSINAAIKDCSDKGGGIVAVPEGVFVSGTVQLRSNVTLHLAPKAVLKGSDSPADYTSFIPSKDLSRYDSGEGGDNANSSKDANWNKVLLLAAGVEDAQQPLLLRLPEEGQQGTLAADIADSAPAQGGVTPPQTAQGLIPGQQLLILPVKL